MYLDYSSQNPPFLDAQLDTPLFLTPTYSEGELAQKKEYGEFWVPNGSTGVKIIVTEENGRKVLGTRFSLISHHLCFIEYSLGIFQSCKLVESRNSMGLRFRRHELKPQSAM